MSEIREKIGNIIGFQRGIEITQLELLIRAERVKAHEKVIKTMQNLDEYRDLVKYLAANYEVMKLTNLLDELKQSLAGK